MGGSVNRRRALQTIGVGSIAAVLTPPADTVAQTDLEANKDVVRRFITEVVNAGDVDAALEIIADNYTPTDPDDIAGRDALLQRLADNRRGRERLVEEGAFVIDDLVAERDIVAARMRYTGVALSGDSVDALALSIFQIDQGKITTLWGLADTAALLEQTRP